MSAQKHGFQTEVAKLLDLLANSLYSNKEVFLRELISNASDAIEKLRFLSLSDTNLTKDDPVFAIRVKADSKEGTLTISDNGIGMSLEEANDHLGTIAKSGTEEFFKSLSGDAAKDAQLIGQFGVGFYSSFIVADRVTVLTRKAGLSEAEGVRWESTGNGEFESENTPVKTRGTEIILHLKADEKRFLETWTLREAIEKYSDHIAVPVYLWEEKFEAPKEGEKEDEKKEPKFEYTQVNEAKALWTLNPREVKDEQYKEFYKHLTHDYSDPLSWAHNKVEGDLEYTSLLFIPSEAPWDLYSRDAVRGLKLFVERVFIMDKAEAFLPNYLRFVRGLVDTNALPLNVSRELLQESEAGRKLKKALTKRALDMIAKLAEDKEKYAKFWAQFGRVLKEGPVEDYANAQTIAKLLRFASTKEDSAAQSVSLADYVSRMPEGQKKIYYLVSSSYQNAKSSPYLELFRKKGIEVLLLWDRIDEWMVGHLHEFEGKAFVSASASDLELGDLADKPEKSEAEKKASDGLIARMKAALGGKVKDVRVSTRLVGTPSCVVADAGQFLTPQMKRMLEAAGQSVPEDEYILEIDPENALLKKAASETDEAKFKEWAELVFEQALLSEQGSLKDPNAFLQRVNRLLSL